MYNFWGIFTWKTKRIVRLRKYLPLHLSLLQMHKSFASIVTKKKKKKSGTALLTFHHGTFTRPIKSAAPFDS